jgi:hypothetical protein
VGGQKPPTFLFNETFIILVTCDIKISLKVSGNNAVTALGLFCLKIFRKKSYVLLREYLSNVTVNIANKQTKPLHSCE